MQLLSITTIVLGLLATAGCGKSEPAKPADDKPKAAEVFSCDDQAAHRCVEHHQENLKMGTGRAEGKCKKSPTGTFAAVACPTAGLIGRCTTALEIENYYTGAPMNEAELKAACDGRGTFSKP